MRFVYFLYCSLNLLFIASCSDDNGHGKSPGLESRFRTSCMVKDNRSILICFEGEYSYVKKKCDGFKMEHTMGAEIIYSSNRGCPRNIGFVGYCVMDGGEYIPYDYIDPMLNLSEKDKNIMIEGYKNDCLKFSGQYHTK